MITITIIKNHVKLMVAGLLITAAITGCASNSNSAIPFTQTDNSDDNAGEQNTQSDAEAVQAQEQADAVEEQTQDINQSQSQPTDIEIENELAAYRAEREKGVSSLGDYTMVAAPNVDNYDFNVGHSDSYTTRFDSKELTEAFKTAMNYVTDTLNLEPDVWSCADPRIIAIYEDEDKGVANGYDADNIFICEYNNNGNWQYLILVREKKGSAWEVLFNGSSYKTD